MSLAKVTSCMVVRSLQYVYYGKMNIYYLIRFLHRSSYFTASPRRTTVYSTATYPLQPVYLMIAS